jgi:hypothetical protein
MNLPKGSYWEDDNKLWAPHEAVRLHCIFFPIEREGHVKRFALLQRERFEYEIGWEYYQCLGLESNQLGL